jgi:hypothetical protein
MSSLGRCAGHPCTRASRSVATTTASHALVAAATHRSPTLTCGLKAGIHNTYFSIFDMSGASEGVASLSLEDKSSVVVEPPHQVDPSVAEGAATAAAKGQAKKAKEEVPAVLKYSV